MATHHRRTQPFLCIVILVLCMGTAVLCDDVENVVHVKSVKKELKEDIKDPPSSPQPQPPPPQTDQKPNNVPEEKVQSNASNIENKNTNENNKQKPTEKTDAAIITSSTFTGKVDKTPVITTTPTPSPASAVLVHQEETILGSNEDISDSLKAGSYFFAALSLSAILFIVFKIYRLRLSRAERKYGVQGDRTTQELTPLPIAIEDGHSDDDEDHTVFEVQRQNIRIL